MFWYVLCLVALLKGHLFILQTNIILITAELLRFLVCQCVLSFCSYFQYGLMLHVCQIEASMLEEEVPMSSALWPWLVWYLDALDKHTTVDSAPRCLSRRRIVKMIYFKLWVLEFNNNKPCAHMLPIAYEKRVSKIDRY